MHPWLLQLQPGAFTQIDISSAATPIPVDLLDPSSHSLGPVVAATISPQGGNMRYRCDGTDPTAAVGMPAANGDIITISGHSVLKAFLAILSTGVTVLLDVQLYHL